MTSLLRLNGYEQQRASELLFKALERGIGVVLIEHSMDMVMSICDRITVINFGKVIAKAFLPRWPIIRKLSRPIWEVTTMLTIKDLHAYYGQIEALKALTSVSRRGRSSA